MINFIHIHTSAIASCINFKDKVLLETISASQTKPKKRTLAETKIFQKLVFDFDQVWNWFIFFSLKILDAPSATWCENNWQGARKGPRQFPLISCHADDMLDFSTVVQIFDMKKSYVQVRG